MRTAGTNFSVDETVLVLAIQMIGKDWLSLAVTVTIRCGLAVRDARLTAHAKLPQAWDRHTLCPHRVTR